MCSLATVKYFIWTLYLASLSSAMNVSGYVMVEPVLNVQQHIRQKLDQKGSQESTLEPSFNDTSPTPVKFHSKMYLGHFHAKFGFRDQYMAHCETKEDCDAGIRMICQENKCICRPGELFFEWPKFGCFVKAHMFEKCEVSGQCMAMNPHTYCNPDNGRCTCSPNYFFNGHECSLRYDTTNLKAQEVYKAAVVAAACFIVAVVGIFVACIVRRSFCRREQQLQQSESNRNSDIFSISDEIAAMRAVDKPPSYEEVLQIERTFYGIPPPEYSGPRNSPATPAPNNSETNYTVLPDAGTQPISQLSACAASSSGSSSLSENTKELTTSVINMNENLCDTVTHHSNSNVSDFVTSAEVLPVPSNVENSPVNISSLLPGTSSLNNHHKSHSSTPPAPRVHRHPLKSNHGSSSLPSSPYLSSISSKVDVVCVNFDASPKKELLKGNSRDSSAVPSHLSEDPFLSSETLSVASLPHEISTNDITPDFEQSVTVIAYDNLGFESDLYL